MDSIAILRRCVRCERLESIDLFSAGARVCRPCMDYSEGGRVGRATKNRTIRITKLGRADLDEWRREQHAV